MSHFDEFVLYDAVGAGQPEAQSGNARRQAPTPLQREAIEGMIELLEALAVRLLTNGGQPVDLRTFGVISYDIARVLWKMSEEDAGTEQAEDARARLGMRSLLKPFPKPGKHEAWPVTFCHRSMSEYFVAQALLRALRHDHRKASDLLSSVILGPEITDFAALGVNKDECRPIWPLRSPILARSAGRGAMRGYLGRQRDHAGLPQPLAGLPSHRGSTLTSATRTCQEQTSPGPTSPTACYDSRPLTTPTCRAPT